jgi:hypothetical protein
MSISIYTVITIITLTGYGIFMFWSHFLIRKLATHTSIPKYWSGRISIVELEKLMLETNEENIVKTAKRAILYIRLSRYIGYSGVILFVVLMIINSQ